MTPAELVAELDDVGATLTDARRVLAHVRSHGRDPASLPRMRRAVLEAVISRTQFQRLEIVERERDPVDGFVKYLLRSPDGALSEAVRIPLKAEGRYSVCLSSQVGCAMGCTFCATARLGLSRNLEAWEMVAAFIAVRDDVEGRLGGAVFMGQGEPLKNYDAVIRAAQILSDPNGGRIAQRSISISTVGLVPQIRRYTREGHRFRLIVSLTSTDPVLRKQLLPVAGKTNIDELVDAIAEHARASGTPATVAWVLLGGVNDKPNEAARLKALFDDVRVTVNLIDVNPIEDEGTDAEFRRSTGAERERFRDALAAERLSMVRRYSGGSSRHAACGMLSNRRGARTMNGGCS
jgi:23S rRNA (adenine2503-C2)-methyltransferase